MEFLNILLTILNWILFGIFSVVFLLIIIWAVNSIITFIKHQTPFLPAPLEALPEIMRALSVTDSSVVYDLGSGDGRVVEYIAEHSKATVIGIENGIFPFILSKINFLIHRKKYKGNVVLKFKNFFKEDLSKATHIFMYIRPNTMDDIIGKFDDELKGVKVVSLGFKFTQKRPAQEIDFSIKRKMFNKIYVYEF